MLDGVIGENDGHVPGHANTPRKRQHVKNNRKIRDEWRTCKQHNAGAKDNRSKIHKASPTKKNKTN